MSTEQQSDQEDAQKIPNDKEEAAVSTGATTASFPEGGRAAWLTVTGGAMVMFVTFGVLQSFGVFQDYYTRVSLTDKTPSDISWIGSVQGFFFFGTGLFSGKMFDEGYFHHLMIGGSLLYLFSFFMLSLTKPHQYYQVFLSQGLGMGLGMGLLFLPALMVCSHYFRVRRSLSMGVAFSGASLGGLIFPIMFNHLFHGKSGFAWGVRAGGFLSLGLLLLANLLMRTRLPSRRSTGDVVKPDYRKFTTDVPYILAICGSFFVFWGLYFPFFYLQLFSVLHGVDQNLAFYSITILNAASTFGRTVPNFMSDSYGIFNVILPMGFVSGILIFAMFGTGTAGGMIVFSILYGFFSGGFLSLTSPLIVFFSTGVHEVGARMGVGSFILAFALLTGTPISGALLNPPVYSWAHAIIFNGVVVLSGTSMLVVSRWMMVKRKGTQRI